MKKTGALIFLFVIILIIFLLFNPYRVPAGAVRIRTIDGMEMAYIPAGVFIMGSNSGESHEQPVHEVYLHDFWIDRTEITNAMFNLFYEDTGHITDGENARASYVFINWGLDIHRAQTGNTHMVQAAALKVLMIIPSYN